MEKVFEGRDVAACADVGKKLALEIGGKRESEHSDLVLWTAGAHPFRSAFPIPNSNGFVELTTPAAHWLLCLVHVL